MPRHFAPRTEPTSKNPRGLTEGDRVFIEWNHAYIGRIAAQTDGVHVVVRSGSSAQYQTEPRLVLVPESIAADPEALRKIRAFGDARFLIDGHGTILGMYEAD